MFEEVNRLQNVIQKLLRDAGSKTKEEVWVLNDIFNGVKIVQLKYTSCCKCVHWFCAQQDQSCKKPRAHRVYYLRKILPSCPFYTFSHLVHFAHPAQYSYLGHFHDVYLEHLLRILYNTSSAGFADFPHIAHFTDFAYPGHFAPPPYFWSRLSFYSSVSYLLTLFSLLIIFTLLSISPCSSLPWNHRRNLTT